MTVESSQVEKLNERLNQLTGSTNPQEAGIIAASDEVGKIKSLRGLGRLYAQIPLVDFFSIYPKLYPFIIECECKEHIGMTAYSSELDKFQLHLRASLDPLNKQETFAHELGHFLIRNSKGFERLKNTREEDLFCDGFARHLVLPDEEALPALEAEFSLSIINDLASRFGLPKESLIKWLADHQFLMDRSKRGALISRWGWMPKDQHQFGSDFQFRLA